MMMLAQVGFKQGSQICLNKMLVIFRSYMDHAPRFRGEKTNVFETTTYSSLVEFLYWERFPGWNSDHVSGCLGGRAVLRWYACIFKFDAQKTYNVILPKLMNHGGSCYGISSYIWSIFLGIGTGKYTKVSWISNGWEGCMVTSKNCKFFSQLLLGVAV